jgi:hypothetical protein
MISAEEIKKQALLWWKPFLQSHISGISFFPKTIDRIGKIKSGNLTGNFEEIQAQVSNLYLHSKSNTGSGYIVMTANRTFRRTGSHELPDRIVFETMEDYLSFIHKKKDWLKFLENYELLITAIPSLKEWALPNCLLLTSSAIEWPDILKVCQYFILNPRPNLYIRQLPIEVHTKFIEENASLLQSLLQSLIPDHIRDPRQQRFAERFYLRYDEPLVRIRVLDPSYLFAGKLSDISIPLSDFQQLNIDVKQIVITENKMNFLTLPGMKSTIAIWSGGGFNVSYLKGIEWMKDKDIFYWGDIDEHGFGILHQIRSYYAGVKSVMMDKEVFEEFKKYSVKGERNKAESLSLLTEVEAEMYKELKGIAIKNRLEQEKIPQSYIDKIFMNNISTGLEGNG